MGCSDNISTIFAVRPVVSNEITISASTARKNIRDRDLGFGTLTVMQFAYIGLDALTTEGVDSRASSEVNAAHVHTQGGS